MTRNERFGLISLGRATVPVLANPSGTVDSTARLMLMHCFPRADAPTVSSATIGTSAIRIQAVGSVAAIRIETVGSVRLEME